MKYKLALIAAAAAVFAASPAAAGEGRIEARGGWFWTTGYDQATAGAAAGYDFDLGDKAFLGFEASGDKILDGGTRIVFGATTRLGVRAGEKTKLYAAGGYATKPCAACVHSWTAGAGIEQEIAGNVYLKAEYRHFFVGSAFADGDAVLAGIGVKLR